MSGKLKCIYQNTRGLRTKIAKGLRNRTMLMDYQLFALTETWLNDKFHSESIFDGNQFNVYRSDRSIRTYPIARGRILNDGDRIVGGGCLIALKKKYSCIEIS